MLVHFAKQTFTRSVITAYSAYVHCNLAVNILPQRFVPARGNIPHALSRKLADNLNPVFISPVKDLISSHYQCSPTSLSRLQKQKSGYNPINNFWGVDRTGSVNATWS